ncbi:uncharacterized protein LOC131011108 [Salvia miltiorrhiza]|uniref:uncharacterized protein LOC131011108 n=1 Tax=Salvia miltiorrhiza TaxID=226208 RepID=UPI0025ABE626|nr:uncharacterized protein LOC131011108 [Salvia miltiorrhiza]
MDIEVTSGKKRCGSPMITADMEVPLCKKFRLIDEEENGDVELALTAEAARWKSFLEFDGHFVVNPNGASGGLMLFWKDPLDVAISSYSPGHIDCRVSNDGVTWRFTGFYGHPDAAQRHHSWEMLRRLGENGGDLSWLSVKTNADFSWSNRRKGEAAIWELIDRFLINAKWANSSGVNDSQMLDFYGSDHRAVKYILEKPEVGSSQGGFKRFFFEQKWMLAKNFTADLLMEWRFSGGLPVHQRLEWCQRYLEKWKNSDFDNPTKKIEELRKKRIKLLNAGASKSTSADLKVLEADLERMLEAEEVHWKQRSRANWLGFGDRNTSYFHAFASARKKKNDIPALVDNLGVLQKDDKVKALIVQNYFSEMFKSDSPQPSIVKAVTARISSYFGEEEVRILDAPFTKNDVRNAVFQMSPHKAPGPDGFPPVFFQKYWGEIGGTVTKEVLQVLNGGGKVQEWNKTLIVLIPKITKPTRVSDFRPISLCNTLYKIVTKALVNRIRDVLGSVINDSQSAFVPGRMISDNILVGYECMHWPRNQKKGKVGFAAAKLDMRKAYDRVEWPFLRAMLLRLGFPRRMVEIIMDCVTSVSFSFVINRKVYGSLVPTRGIRQGCPLSPFLFVICAQGLSAGLYHYERRQLIEGIKVAKMSPAISHLFFADDSLLFFKASATGVRTIKNLLEEYSSASGQLVNLEKSAVSFSPCSSRQDIEMVVNTLGIRETSGHSMYLGLPTFIVRKKKVQFDYLRERVYKKLSSWKNKFFSAGGKEILIKSVIQAIPTYTMSCFKVPMAVCADIERACSNFWWGETDSGKQMHWASWEKLCLQKSKGGLGFRRLGAFNQSLLAKQAWRLLKFPNSLVARVLKGRYYKDGDLLKAQPSSNASYSWRSITWGRDLLKGGLRWRVGNGNSIKAFHDPWIPVAGSGIAVCSTGDQRDVLVKDFMDGSRWSKAKLAAAFLPFEACAIETIPLSRIGVDDDWYWIHDEKGRFSVKSGYLLATDFYTPHPATSPEEQMKWYRQLWSTNIPPKAKIFVWRATNNLIATDSNLVRHHIPTTEVCSWCNRDWGSTVHCLLFCERVSDSWKKSPWWSVIKKCKRLTLEEICKLFLEVFNAASFEFFCMGLWSCWRWLCAAKHGTASSSFFDDLSWGEQHLEVFQQAKLQILGSLRLLPKEGDSRWIPPRRGLLRLDVDFSFHDISGAAGVGFLVRDWTGSIIAAAAHRVGRTETILMGELHAMLLGIGFCLEQDLGPIVLYSDSMLAIHVVHEDYKGMDSLSDELFEAFVVAKDRIVVDFRHVRREANRAAHNLANFAAWSDGVMIWKQGFPAWLTDIVHRDLE